MYAINWFERTCETADEADVYLYGINGNGDVAPYGTVSSQDTIAIDAGEHGTITSPTGIHERVEERVEDMAATYETDITVYVLGECGNEPWYRAEKLHNTPHQDDDRGLLDAMSSVWDRARTDTE